MGTYFNNETLDALWVRLVSRTEELCANEIGIEKWILSRLVAEDEEEPGTVAIIYNQEYLCFGGDPGQLLNETTNEMINVRDPQDYFEEIGESMPGELYGFETGLVPLYSLNKNHTYIILNGYDTTRREYKMVYKRDEKLQTGSVREIHDVLVSHFGLEHDKLPETIGDYMKGIAVAARYNLYQYIDSDTKENLETIVSNLEQNFVPGIILSVQDTGSTIEISCWQIDPEINPEPSRWEIKIIRNSTDEVVGITNNSYIEDIRSIITDSLIKGEEYTVYASGWYGNEESYDSDSFVWNYENIDAWNPGYTCTLSATGVLTLSNEGFETGFYLYDADTGEKLYDHSADGATTYDLKDYYFNFIEGNRYYAVGRWWNSNGTEYTARSNTIVYSSSGEDFIEWISAILFTIELNNDIRFNVDYSYSSSDLFIEGALVTLYDDTLGETVVSEWQAPIDGNTPDAASFAFLATDLYTNYVYDSHYILTVTTYENIPDNNIWDTVSTEFTWPFEESNEEGEGPRDLSVVPDAYLMNEGRVYISNYVGTKWENLDVYISYYYNDEYDTQEAFLLGADGYVKDCYLDSSGEWSYRLYLYDMLDGEDVYSETVWISTSA